MTSANKAWCNSHFRSCQERTSAVPLLPPLLGAHPRFQSCRQPCACVVRLSACLSTCHRFLATHAVDNTNTTIN